MAAGAQLSSSMQPRLATSASADARVAVLAELLFSREDSDAAALVVSKLAQATRQERGCIRYEAARDLDQPGRFHLSELWENIGALADHFETPHMAAFSAAARDLGYSAPFIKLLEIAGMSDFKPSDLRPARRR